LEGFEGGKIMLGIKKTYINTVERPEKNQNKLLGKMESGLDKVEIGKEGLKSAEEIQFLQFSKGVTKFYQTTQEKPLSSEKMRDWNFIVFKIAGHGLEGDIKQGLNNLNKSGTSSNTYITVRAEEDGKISDYSVKDSEEGTDNYLSPASGGLTKRDASLTPMLSKRQMTQFLLNSMKDYPAKKYLVAFEGHSAQLREAMPEIHKSLENAVKESGKKIDALVLDSCFMSQIETASEFKDVANVMIASQDGVVKFRPYEDMAKLGKNISSKELAEYIVQSSNEFTMSATDLGKVDILNQKMKVLGKEILKIEDKEVLKEIRKEIEASQHYYTEVTPIGKEQPNTFRNTVDIYDFLSHITRNSGISKDYPHLSDAAKDILQYLDVKSDGVIFAEKHKMGIDRYLLDYTKVESSHGLSMHLPTTPEIVRDEYTHFENSRFDRETSWDNVINHITGSKSPIYIASSVGHYFSGLVTAGINYAMERADEKKRAHEN
jgi:hypothetical protein